MTFYVEKSLAHGPIRFGVLPRLALDQIDSDATLSTGPVGDFLRRRHQGFFYADTTPVGAIAVPKTYSISGTSLWSSLAPHDAKSWGWVILMILGAIFVLMGLIVAIGADRWQGWVEALLGAAMIATPIILTARQRREIQAKEDQERLAREERERRHAEMLSAYSSALEELRRSATPEALARSARERQQLELPYKVWAPLARRTVLHVGFDALSRLGPARAAEVAKEMDRAASSVGLTEDDAGRVKVSLYGVIVWHLLADDRLGRTQVALLESLRKDFGMTDGVAPIEEKAVSEFDALRGTRASNLPREQVATAVQFHEYGIFTTPITIVGKSEEKGSLHLTNKRLILEGRRRVEITLGQVDDVYVDPDENTLTLRAAHPHKPVVIRVERPIYTAAIIDLATNIDERPRSFA